MKKGCFVVLFVFLCASGIGGWYLYKSRNPPQEWVVDEIDEGRINQTISATGSLAALTTVAVGCQISGIIASIGADFNDVVREGRLIAQLDPSTYEAQLQQSTANLENVRASERNVAAQIENLKANLLTAKADQKVQDANVAKARVALADAERNLKRNAELQARKLVAIAELESAQSGVDSAKAALEAAKAQVESAHAKEVSILAQIEAAKAQRDGSLAQIRQMEALLNVAKINLSRTKIFSPIDGIVVSRNVDVGQTVAASLQAPTLFTIANDLKKMQINTSVDESDIGKVKEGQDVSFTVDAYKNRRFKGIVGQVRLSPIVSQNVVTYPVMVDVLNADLSLRPGMTANVEIIVDVRDKAMRLPTRALFYKPPKEFLPSDLKMLADSASGAARVWVLGTDSRPIPIDITIGISNNQFSEVLGDGLKLGQAVLIPEEKTGSKNGHGGGSRRGGMVMRIH